jgi:cell division protein FtsW (lipid II flippase)
MRRETGFVALYAVASAAAILLGAAVMALNGSSMGAWSRNVFAWLVGALLAFVLARVRLSAASVLAMLFMPLFCIAATFAAPDVEGVHRWVDIGPLHINMAALLLPMAIVALAAMGINRVAAVGTGLALAALLMLQPDASQATGLLVAVFLLSLRAEGSLVLKIAVLGIVAIATIVAWSRPDPLQPVEEVELILALAWRTSATLALLAVAALACTCLSPLVLAGRQEVRAASLALSAYFLTVSLAPLFGVFPVPLVGLGMSFPVGFWLGIGGLEALRRAAVTPQAREAGSV